MIKVITSLFAADNVDFAEDTAHEKNTTPKLSIRESMKQENKSLRIYV